MIGSSSDWGLDPTSSYSRNALACRMSKVRTDYTVPTAYLHPRRRLLASSPAVTPPRAPAFIQPAVVLARIVPSLTISARVHFPRTSDK